MSQRITRCIFHPFINLFFDYRFSTETLCRKTFTASQGSHIFLLNSCFTPFRGSKTLLLCKSRGQAVQVPLWKLPEVGASRGAAEPDHPRQVRTGHLPACWCGENGRGGGWGFTRIGSREWKFWPWHLTLGWEESANDNQRVDEAGKWSFSELLEISNNINLRLSSQLLLIWF